MVEGVVGMTKVKNFVRKFWIKDQNMAKALILAPNQFHFLDSNHHLPNGSGLGA